MSDPGLSKARLGSMHEVMAGYVERGEIPGLVTLVSRHGEVHVDAIGRKSLDGDDPVAHDTIFRIASLSKPITAVAAMVLVEECKLRLDDAVDGWLPELSNRQVMKRLDGPIDDTVPANRPISLRDLLTFRMGIGLVFAPPDTYPIQKAMAEQLDEGPPNPDHKPTPDEWISRLGRFPLVHQPGECWMYNTGSDVLGVLIARAAGRPLETFLHERIFEPLGMKDTGFSVPADKIDRLATAYSVNPETGVLQVNDPALGGQWSRPPAFPSGGGGLASTIDDYFVFAQMLRNHGKHGSARILSRPSVETMTIDHLTPAQKVASNWLAGWFESRGWGFGMSVVTKRDEIARSVGAYGWDGGLGTTWYTDPREDMVTILMTQVAWTSPNPPNVTRDFLTSAYQAIDD
jgi:CubicO group peptidase (beta-lactamase class C family)